MAYNRAQAQKLCNESELQLVVASMADEVVKLTAAQLRSKITRARTLRDKNTDLFRRQTTATRGATSAKRGNTGVANQRTQQKARLFDETLKRLETRLLKVEAAAAKLASKPAEKPAAKAAVARKSPTKAAVPKAPAQPAPPKKSVARRAAAKTAVKPAAKKAAAKTTVKAAVKSALDTTAKKPVAKAAPAKAAPAKAAVARSQRPATAVSKVVSVRGKNIGAHARSANARGQAKRGGR